MTTIRVKRLKIGLAEVEETTYAAILLEPTHGNMFSLTIHPYQFEKLRRSLSEHVGQSAAKRVQATKGSDLLISTVEIHEVEADHLAVTTRFCSQGDDFRYEIDADSGKMNLLFDRNLQEVLLGELTRLSDQIQSLRRH
jgi:hypothetical protein